MKTSTFLAKMVLFAGVILSESPVFSQRKFEISGGVGIPEMTSVMSI
jgi:hypothetical protein